MVWFTVNLFGELNSNLFEDINPDPQLDIIPDLDVVKICIFGFDIPGGKFFIGVGVAKEQDTINFVGVGSRP